MNKKITMENRTFEERGKDKGGFRIIVGNEPCYTCGHKKQMAYPEKSDGRVEVKYKCMYCSVRVHIHANRSGS